MKNLIVLLSALLLLSGCSIFKQENKSVPEVNVNQNVGDYQAFTSDQFTLSYPYSWIDVSKQLQNISQIKFAVSNPTPKENFTDNINVTVEPNLYSDMSVEV
ncbi:hypothetical protein [Paenibacillus sinensis]|nr:hypothetical protein [Paenibacillus sinensis]